MPVDSPKVSYALPKASHNATCVEDAPRGRGVFFQSDAAAPRTLPNLRCSFRAAQTALSASNFGTRMLAGTSARAPGGRSPRGFRAHLLSYIYPCAGHPTSNLCFLARYTLLLDLVWHRHCSLNVGLVFPG